MNLTIHQPRVFYDLPSDPGHKSMILRGARMPKPSLDRNDIEEVKQALQRGAGRSYGGAPLGRKPREQFNFRSNPGYDGRSNRGPRHDSRAHSSHPRQSQDYRGGHPAAPPMWVPPPPGHPSFGTGLPPPPPPAYAYDNGPRGPPPNPYGNYGSGDSRRGGYGDHHNPPPSGYQGHPSLGGPPGRGYRDSRYNPGDDRRGSRWEGGR